MPRLSINGAEIFYETHGDGPETIVFAHGLLWSGRMIANHHRGISRAIKGMVERYGIYEQIGRIAIPTLIIIGNQDTATVPEKSERIHGRISGSKLAVIPGAGHSSTIEEPAAVNFDCDLVDLSLPMQERYGAYLRTVGGDAFRDKVFDYTDKEDSPRPVTYQLALLRKVGFRHVELLLKIRVSPLSEPSRPFKELHKNGCAIVAKQGDTKERNSNAQRPLPRPILPPGACALCRHRPAGPRVLR